VSRLDNELQEIWWTGIKECDKLRELQETCDRNSGNFKIEIVLQQIPETVCGLDKEGDKRWENRK